MVGEMGELAREGAQQRVAPTQSFLGASFSVTRGLCSGRPWPGTDALEILNHFGTSDVHFHFALCVLVS